MQLRTNIASERVKADLTQVELAERLGVSPKTLRDWEKGKRRPNPEAIASIAKSFGCSTDYLLCLTEERMTR